jgi:putative oxidoreductase
MNQNLFNSTFFLRVALAVIFIMHSVPGFFNNGVYLFGTEYLNKIGFAPVGLPLAYLIKLSHVVASICFLMDKFVKPLAWVTIAILVAGIVMVHAPQGWFVVGGGTNGVEFNFLLNFALLTLIFPQGLKKQV